MRIKEVADAASTTPRTVRHYHRLGLMAEPSRSPNGYREYAMRDVIRLMRIRWLADSGVPLGSIGTMLERGRDGESRDDLTDDLRALLDGVESEQKRLQHRHSRLAALLSDAEQGRTPTALPHELVSALDTALAEASDAHERTALERERDMLEAMAISGSIPPNILAAMTDAIADRAIRVRYLSMLRRWSSLEHQDPADHEDEISGLATELATLLPIDQIAANATGDAQPFVGLHDLIPDPAQRRVVLAAADIMTGGTDGP